MPFRFAFPLTVTVRGGARICLPPELTTTAYVLLEQEDWFEHEIAFVRKWVAPGMRCVDVGANFGVYTIAMAKAVGARGRVWAFEPTPGTAQYLERSLQLNGLTNTSVIRAAVSDHSGSIGFAIGEDPELNAVAGEAAGNMISVSAVTLAAAAREHGFEDADFVKLDVEGHELEAIAGARGWLHERSPLVMFEIKAGNEPDLRALAPLAELGYGLYTLVPGPLLLAPFEVERSLDKYSLNLFAAKPDRAANLAAAGFLLPAGRSAAPRVQADAWTAYAARAPYARDLARGWRAKPRLFFSAGEKSYLRGLAAYAQSSDELAPAAERLALLQQACACIEEALRARESIARQLSFARVAAEAGLRERAVEALLNAAQALEASPSVDASEPFLTPSAAYEGDSPGADVHGWLLCRTIEEFERLWQYSSRFGGAHSTFALQKVIESPFHSVETERRWQLVRMSAGLQAGPQASPLLTRASAENLNADFWRASQA